MTFTLTAVITCFAYTFSMRNPFPEVEWIKDYPGATERYIEYTPVLKADRRIKLGPGLGADYATLRFKDINNDGVKEAIIETEILIDWGEFRSPERHVLQYKKTASGLPQFVSLAPRAGVRD
ncbi:MAG: hypothetical protein ABIN97_01815 [Ginsengibacter sp.]